MIAHSNLKAKQKCSKLQNQSLTKNYKKLRSFKIPTTLDFKKVSKWSSPKLRTITTWVRKDLFLLNGETMLRER